MALFRFSILAVALGSWASVAFGSDPGTPSSPTPPASSWIAQANENGITFPFTYTADYFGCIAGNSSGKGAYAGLVQFGLQLDLEKLCQWKGASFVVNALYPHGPGPTNDLVRDFNGISNIDAYDSFRLNELWFQQDYAGFSLRVGQMSVDSEFCISNGANLFINSAFGTIPLLSQNIQAPIYPVPAPGIRLKYAPTNGYFAQIGVFPADAGNPSTTNRHGTRFFQGSTGTLLLGEMGYTLNPPTASGSSNNNPSPRPLSGTYKLGVFYDSETFPPLTGVLTRRGEYAVYAIADQELWNEAGDSQQGLRAFAHGGFSPSDRSVADLYFDAGLTYQGLLPHRPKDLCGVGISYTHISSTLRDGTGTLVPSHYETILEASYLAAVYDWLSVQPDLQCIFNPGATGTQPTAVVLGLRCTATF